MLKHISICAALALLAMSPIKAQQHEAMLQQVELPGAGFYVVLATPKSPAGIMDLNSPDALILPLIGGELALAFEDGWKMLQAIDFLKHPGCAFEVNSDDGKSTKPVSIYVVPKRAMQSTRQTTSLDVPLPENVMRALKAPGTNLHIVYATTRTPITWESHERPDALAVYLTGYELMMATERDIKRMFEDVRLSQWPLCALYVEHIGANPPEAASVYVVPEGNWADSVSQ